MTPDDKSAAAPRLYLAPMEGLTDFYMRDLLTHIGQYDACVTEFVRVTNRLLPARAFYRACPELRSGGRTAAGTPVHLQLLGSEPQAMADNAARAAVLGAPSIDLNFGCPAKTVNRHRGGVILLDEPETVYAIVAAVRCAVPSAIPVTAKMRLGVSDRSRMRDNATAIAAAGAAALVVHARTRQDGYRPPAHWEAIAELRACVRIPLMANGEIWTTDDAQRCCDVSGCRDLMLGRGALTDPALVNGIRGDGPRLDWPTLCAWQRQFLVALQAAMQTAQQAAAQATTRAAQPDEESHGEILPGHPGVVWTEHGAIGRYKQWLGMLTRRWPEAAALFQRVKKSQRFAEVMAALALSKGHGDDKS